MFINELSQETVEELCGALEKVPTLDWKVLMRSEWFRSVYSEDDVAKIETAKALLDDMNHREMMLHDLVNGLKAIGNKKAVSIIKKDMKGAEKSGLDLQYSGRRPPYRSSTGQPQEHSSFSRAQPIQRREQSETLGLPVQESVATEGAGYPGLGALTCVVSELFRCFSCGVLGYAHRHDNDNYSLFKG